MKIDDLKEHVWRHLPMRKHVTGRRRINGLVELAIENWESDNFFSARGTQEQDLVVQSVVASIRRMDEVMSDEDTKQYGFIWMLILSGLVSLIVQLILKWWNEKPSHRVLMAGWQKELTS